MQKKTSQKTQMIKNTYKKIKKPEQTNKEE